MFTAIDDYTAGDAPYLGGALPGFDQFVSKDRIIRKREDYLHIHERETDEDLNCIILFNLPRKPSELKYVQALVDSAGLKALVVTEHIDEDTLIADDKTEWIRIRWWLLRENGVWKIHEFEPIFS